MHAICRVAGLTVLLATASIAHGQVTIIRPNGPPSQRDKQFNTVRLTVTPSRETNPPMRYRLLPPLSDIAKGNATTCYYRSLILLREMHDYAKNDEIIAAMFGGDEAKPVPAKVGREIIGHSVNVLREVELGARRDRCDWDLPLKEGGFSLLLPEFQQLRSLARLLGYKAHVEIADGNFAAAAGSLQTLFAMSRDTAKAPLLITGLIGIATGSIGLEMVQEWIAAPNSPNLYWALATLPRPVIAGGAATQQEIEMIRTMFPEVFGFDGSQRTPAEWQRMLAKAVRRLGSFEGTGAGDANAWTGFADQSMALALSLKAYPAGKRALLEAGKSPAEVDAMPVAQVVLQYSRDTFERIAQQHLRWWSTPYWVSRPAIDKENAKLSKSRTNFDEGIPIASLLMPAYGQASTAFARFERRIAALQIIEALRIHAAKFGKFPASLDEIKVVPIPLDPVTGTAFDYKLADGKAILDLTKGPSIGGNNGLRYELVLKAN